MYWENQPELPSDKGIKRRARGVTRNIGSSPLTGLNCLLRLVRAVAGLLPLNQNSQKHEHTIIGPCRACQKVVPLYIG